MTDLRKILAEATPGPWRYKLPFYGSDEYDTGFFILGKHPKVGSVSHASVRYGCDEAKELGNIKANARLIALTPQLAAALIKAREGLAEIGRQKRTDELVTEYDVEVADFEAGYDLCVDRARATLAEIDALMGGDGD